MILRLISNVTIYNKSQNSYFSDFQAYQYTYQLPKFFKKYFSNQESFIDYFINKFNALSVRFLKNNFFNQKSFTDYLISEFKALIVVFFQF